MIVGLQFNILDSLLWGLRKQTIMDPAVFDLEFFGLVASLHETLTSVLLVCHKTVKKRV